MPQNLWQDSNKNALQTIEYTGDTLVDLAVVGGGFTGCSAALTAAQTGASVTLLEAHLIGHGGSGRNVGLVNAGLWLPPESVIKRLGQAAGQRLNTALAAAPAQVFDLIERHGIDCEPQRNGTLHLAQTKAGLANLRDRLRQQQALSAPVALLTAKETAQRVGSNAFYGALHDARAGTVQPLNYLRGLARAAIDAGAELHENSPVLALRHMGDHWRVILKGGDIRARRLLIATNAYHKDTQGQDAPECSVVNYFQLATAPLGDDMQAGILRGGEGCWDCANIMTSVRRDRAGRVILGGMGEFDRTGIHRAWAERKLIQIFPQLTGHSYTHFWSGKIMMTADKLPRIQRLPLGYAIFGYSGRGIAPGTLMGGAAATALLNGDESGLPLDPTGAYVENLPRAKSVFYETAALAAHLVGARF